MWLAVLLFCVGLVALIKGGDWFVDGASGIARRLRMPEFLIGATIVSIGTTLPEVMVSASGAMKGLGEVAYGNALGSIICNTALIAAITLAVRPSKIDRKSIIVPVAFFFGSAIFYSTIAYTTGMFSRLVGIILLAVFVAYTVTVILQAKRMSAEPSLPDEAEEETKQSPLWKDLLFLVIGAALIAIGATLLVDNGTLIAAALGVPDSVIALTFVALGTSLPELVTAITALRKGHGALSLGNIIGANLFNLVLVSGVAVTLNPFAVPENTFQLGNFVGQTSLVIDIPVAFAIMSLLTVPALIKGKLYRWQGYIMLAIYAAFCAVQFVL